MAVIFETNDQSFFIKMTDNLDQDDRYWNDRHFGRTVFSDIGHFGITVILENGHFGCRYSVISWVQV